VVDEGKAATARKPRADAQRNRIRLLETAKAAFAEKGLGPASMRSREPRVSGPGLSTVIFPPATR